MKSSTEWTKGTRFPQYPTLNVAIKAYEAAVNSKVKSAGSSSEARKARAAKFAWQHMLNVAAAKGEI